MRVAIQGERGSFSHEAVLNAAPGAELVPCALSPEVFERVASGDADAAVIPIENSLAGSVTEHFDLLLRHDIRIEAESLVRIRHNLIGIPGASLAGLRRALSHPVALAQCRRFFASHPQVSPAPFYDTAGSVKHVLETGDRALAAIASRQAALSYHGEILAADIEDNPANFTRFWLVRRSANIQPNPAADKVSLAFTVENRPGTLVAALHLLAAHGLNLSKIESRPVEGQPWQYVFYVDYRIPGGHGGDSAALDDLRRECLMVKELGRYLAARAVSAAG